MGSPPKFLARRLCHPDGHESRGFTRCKGTRLHDRVRFLVTIAQVTGERTGLERVHIPATSARVPHDPPAQRLLFPGHVTSRTPRAPVATTPAPRRAPRSSKRPRPAPAPSRRRRRPRCRGRTPASYRYTYIHSGRNPFRGHAASKVLP